MTNPLVAERQDSTTAYSGIGIVESAVDTYNGISSGNWVEGGLGLAGAGLETLGLVVDPVGSLVGYGVAWLMEHVKPLSDALDWLAGDPDTIASYAQTWKNVSQAIGQARTDLDTAVRNDTAAWTGAAGDAYRQQAQGQSEQLSAAATSADTVGTVVEVVGVLVGVVREVVRDLIADCVATLIARIPQWLAMIATGVGIPVAASQAVSLISKWVARISEVITKLVRSVNNLQPLLRRLDEIWAAIKNGLRGLSPGGPTTPGGPSSTTPSSATPVADPATVSQPTVNPNTAPSAPSTPGPAPTSPSATPTVNPDTAPSAPSTPGPAPTSPSASPTVAPSSPSTPSSTPGPAPTTPSAAPTVAPSGPVAPSTPRTSPAPTTPSTSPTVAPSTPATPRPSASPSPSPSTPAPSLAPSGPSTPGTTPGAPTPTTPASTAPTASAPTTNPPGTSSPGGVPPGGTSPGGPPTPGDGGPPNNGGNGGNGGDGPPHDGNGGGTPPNEPPRHSPEDAPPPGPGSHSLGFVDESRVTRGDDGLIDTVDGRPVDQYLRELTDQRTEGFRDRDGFSKADIGPVNSTVIDRQTGQVFEGTNGRPGDVIPDDDLHPVLRERLDALRDAGPYPMLNKDGTPVLDADGSPRTQPYPHPDEPLRHAEVKAVNELLWARGADADASALDDMLLDNRFPFGGEAPRPAPCCVNCHNLLGSPSNVGRFTGWPPGDHNYLPE